MFEYSALVDAPVQRFTGIVTGADPDAEPLAFSVVTPASPVGVAVADAPVMLVATVPDPVEPIAPEHEQSHEPIEQPHEAIAPERAPTHAPRPEHTRPLPAPPLRLTHVAAPRPQASKQPSIVPAVIAIAATAAATTLWLRRGLRGHDR